MNNSVKNKKIRFENSKKKIVQKVQKLKYFQISFMKLSKNLLSNGFFHSRKNFSIKNLSQLKKLHIYRFISPAVTTFYLKWKEFPLRTALQLIILLQLHLYFLQDCHTLSTPISNSSHPQKNV